MTLDELAHAVRNRGGELRLNDGRIRYCGPPLAFDDPIRAAVVVHRDELIRLALDWEVARGRRGASVHAVLAAEPAGRAVEPLAKVRVA